MKEYIDARIGLPDPRKDPVGYGDHLVNIFMSAAVDDYIQTPRSLLQKVGSKTVKVIEKRDGPYPYYKWTTDRDSLIIPDGYVHQAKPGEY